MKVPIYTRLSQTFHGAPDQIVETMRGMSQMLQAEVDARDAQLAQAQSSKMLSPKEYTGFLVKHQDVLMRNFADADVRFSHVAGPTGTPELLRTAYGALLDDFLSAQAALDTIEPPPAYREAHSRFQEFLTSFYRQVASWPASLMHGSRSVSGDSYNLELSATYDLGAYEEAFARGTAMALRA